MSVRAEIVGVGTEFLLGQIANTNARWISERLATVGVDVLHHQAVGDNIPRIIQVLGYLEPKDLLRPEVRGNLVYATVRR